MGPVMSWLSHVVFAGVLQPPPPAMMAGTAPNLVRILDILFGQRWGTTFAGPDAWCIHCAGGVNFQAQTLTDHSML